MPDALDGLSGELVVALNGISARGRRACRVGRSGSTSA